LIEIINQKNNELDELETELSLLDFHNSRESQQHLDLAHERIEKLTKDYQELEVIGARLLNAYNLKEQEASEATQT